jgi:hypothetical protein
MPDRPVEEIRLEIAAERAALATDLDALHDEVRSVVPFAAATLIAVALLANQKRLRTGVKVLWDLL